MSAHAWFWTFALADMAAVFAVASFGVRAIRKKEIEIHRRRMRQAASLVGLFLAAYLIKVALMGREDLSHWDAGSVVILRIHEGFVFSSLILAGYAFSLSRRAVPGVGYEDEKVRSRHRLAGRAAITLFALALCTAALVYRAILTQH